MMPIHELVVATGNPGKIAEFASLFGRRFQLLSLRDVEFQKDIIEDGDSFEANAAIKAHAVQTHVRKVRPSAWVLSDDSGLCVQALGGAPGVHSARYAGQGAGSSANNAKLLAAMSEIADRRAYFVCVLHLAGPNGEQVFRGECHGQLLRDLRGAEGFGYDPLFLPDGYDRSFAEMTAAEKDALSHRGKAAAALVRWWDQQVRP